MRTSVWILGLLLATTAIPAPMSFGFPNTKYSGATPHCYRYGSNWAKPRPFSDRQILQPKEADTTGIDTLINQYVRERGFSGTILIAKNGKPIYHQSFGLGYYATPDTLRNDYHYSVASMTKLFTAIRILQLTEQDQVALHEPVIRYLPHLQSLIPEAVTIHHLLLHISGLPKEKNRIYRHPNDPLSIVTQTLNKNRRGTLGAFRYNNVDYMILGLVIEAISHQSWEKDIRECILEPVGLGETGFLEYGYYPRNFAYTYSQRTWGLRQDPLLYIENFYAAGNMYSTSTDLLKLDLALYTDQLLNDDSRQLLARSYPEYQYTGYGVWNYRYPFVAEQPMVMERRGQILGANVVLVRLTDDQYTIVILSNDDRFNPDSFGDEHNLREKLIRVLYP